MRRLCTATGVIVLLAGNLASPVSAQRTSEVSTTIDAYCAACHDGRMRSASGVLLVRFGADRIASDRDLWSRAFRQLQAGAMPPAGSPRPDRASLEAMLAAIEQGMGVHTRAAARPDSQELARRLASMLWNSVPDAALLEEARRSHLIAPAAVERQVRRMLADDRARSFVERFFFPALELDTLSQADPDRKHFPGYDVSLRNSLAMETRLFLLSQLREDRDPVELWRADYTYLNEQLAIHYGVPGVRGPAFRRVAAVPERAGLLGHGSVHMVTSRHEHGVDAGYTSPAKRSKWVRLNFFGAPLPAGFPGAQPVNPELPITPQTRTLPEQPCVSCHRNFFPLGYALENFDPIGRWRTHDQAGPVNVSGTFVDGKPTNGIIELRQVLLQRGDAFRTTIVEKMLTYASTGSVKSTTPDTLVAARRILRGAAKPRWSALIAGVAAAASPPETPAARQAP